MRRYLRLSVAEQDALDWWEHRLYVEGLVWELADEDDELEEVSEPEELGFTVREH